MDEKQRRREARTRGSGIEYAVDELTIKSPEAPIPHKRSGHDAGDADISIQLSPPGLKRAKLLESLDSALTKPEDTDLPKFRSHTQTAPTPKTEARKRYQAARDRRKPIFSSDDDEEEEEKDFSPTPMLEFNASQTPDYEEEPKVVVKKEPESPKQAAEPVKRRRGRPRKGESEKKSMTVTRRSKRIVENPELRKTHTHEPQVSLVPKPLRALGLGLPMYGNDPKEETATSITKSASGRQKPLTVDAERLHTASTRDRRFTLTTLDVLRQLIDEANPRAVKNEIIDESVVMYDFKAHLLSSISQLMDLHASIKDICHDVVEVQRKKTEMRKSILDLKKEHADVGEQLNKLRNEHNSRKEEQTRFNTTVDSLASLKQAIEDPSSGQGKACLSDTVSLKLADMSRVYQPKSGLQDQLHIINNELAKKIEFYTAEGI